MLSPKSTTPVICPSRKSWSRYAKTLFVGSGQREQATRKRWPWQTGFKCAVASAGANPWPEHYRVRRRTHRLLQRAFAFANLPVDKGADAFSVVIRCTSECDIDNKTISKYARALRYVARRKESDMPLKRFMKEAGGLNRCAAGYARYCGRCVRQISQG